MRQSTIQHNLNYYGFRPLQVLCEEFNKLTNTLKREEQKSTDPYTWLAEDVERKHLTDREILEKYIDLDTLYLNQKEKEELIDMFYKYKEAFSFMDEIGTCPNIEVEIGVIDKSPFFIRPYHVKEDKQILDRERKRLFNLGILKKGFSAYSSPVMITSIKLIKDNRCVSDFRHINMRLD